MLTNRDQVTTTCPNLWDVLGFPGSFDYEPAPWIYFNRKSVRKLGQRKSTKAPYVAFTSNQLTRTSSTHRQRREESNQRTRRRLV